MNVMSWLGYIKNKPPLFSRFYIHIVVRLIVLVTVEHEIHLSGISKMLVTQCHGTVTIISMCVQQYVTAETFALGIPCISSARGPTYTDLHHLQLGG